MLKLIGTKARLEIEKMVETKVFLELFVKVEPKCVTRAVFRRSRLAAAT